MKDKERDRRRKERQVKVCVCKIIGEEPCGILLRAVSLEWCSVSCIFSKRLILRGEATCDFKITVVNFIH